MSDIVEITNRSKFFNITLTETSIIAIAPIISYYLAYTYESGYLSFFHIPASIIYINISTVLYFMSILVGIMFSLLLIANGFYSLYHGHDKIKNNFICRFIWNNHTTFAGAFLFLVIFKFSRTGIIMFIGAITFIVLFELVPAILDKKSGLTLLERVDKHSKYAPPGPSLFGLIKEKYGKALLLFIITTYIFIYIAKLMGIEEAERKNEYYSVSNQDNLYVARFYDNKAICFTFDNTNKVVNPIFSVINISDDPIITFKLVKTGTLKQAK